MPDAAALPDLPGARLNPIAFADLPGWPDDDHVAAFAAFRATCARAPSLRAGRAPPPQLETACEAALRLPGPDAAASRAFFERWFQPLRIMPAGGQGAGKGFLTGYFEPEYPGSLVRTPEFPTPLHGRPADLVTLEPGGAPPHMPANLQGARRLPDGRLEPYPTRREIDEGDAARDWPVIAWLRDPVDRFVMQVQGSASLRLPDGGRVRIAYAGRNGHPYVSLGRLLSEAEAIPPAEMTMDRLVARLKGDAAWGRAFIGNNPSYVFFRTAAELDPGKGPIGGAGVPLTPHRSIAADRAIWAYGLPMWLSGTLPMAERGVSEPLARLTMVQDTGSAIVGPARFDLFHGAGAEAGFLAGLTRHPVEATVLWPRAKAP